VHLVLRPYSLIIPSIVVNNLETPAALVVRGRAWYDNSFHSPFRNAGGPMPDGSSFQDLVRRVRAGDGDAAAELLRRYEPTIRRVARVRLADTRLQRLFDSTDVCQSVFASFFVRTALGQYDLETPEQLLKLLVDMSRKKVIDLARGAGAARRDFRREQGSPEKRQCAAKDPSPSQEVSDRELLQEFRRRLSPEERQLAEERAAGRDWGQIAAERGASAEALRKQLRRAVNRVAVELGLEESHE
jgi:RNA polymerase sigma-70 factor (ECF subfamily)